MFLRVVSLLLFLSAAPVSLRLHCRLFRVHKVGLDDYLIVAALAVIIGMGVMNRFHIAVEGVCTSLVIGNELRN
jgi:divalent metal cation (Fe/Co/Zn/Cd) transporter